MLSPAYSTLKVGWWTDRIEQLRQEGRTRPVTLQLILSDLCNHDCFFCAYRASDGLSTEQFVDYSDGTRNHNPNRMIATEKAREILNDAWQSGIRGVIFTGGGEPTVHPEHLSLFRLAMDRQMEASLNTNGDLLRDGWDEVYPRMAYIRVSIDAGSDEEYQRVRRVPAGRYAKVLGNLKKIAAACSSTPCIVGTGYVLAPEGAALLVEGVKAISDTGASYARIASMQSTRGRGAYTEEQWAACLAAIEEAKKLNRPGFEVIDLFAPTVGRRMTEPLCGMQHFVIYVGANLKAYRCCYVAYTKHGEYGDLSQARLYDWLRSFERTQSCAEFDARSCETCPLADKNHVIAALAQEKPLHVEFI